MHLYDLHILLIQYRSQYLMVKKQVIFFNESYKSFNN